MLLCSVMRGGLVPWAHLAITQRRAFLVVGPSIWNDLPLKLYSLIVSRSQSSTSPSSLFSLVVAGPGALLSSFLKGRYINALNE